jgi:hypothetical protein
MSDYHVVIVFQNQDETRVDDIELVIPTLPQKDNLIGL